MGVTQFVSITTKQYALWQRLEGVARCIDKLREGDTLAARAILREVLADIAEMRNGAA